MGKKGEGYSFSDEYVTWTIQYCEPCDDKILEYYCAKYLENLDVAPKLQLHEKK